MERKTVHFIDGLPRSGSTLLCNILAQNPRFHATATSGILEILVRTRNSFQDVKAFMAMDEEELEKTKLNVMRGILFGYFASTERPVCFDKTRGSIKHLEMYDAVLEESPKVLCCVRDVREVLSSFEKLYRETSATRLLPDEKENFWQYETINGRCQMLMGPRGVVGISLDRIKECVRRGWKVCDDGQPNSNIFFVEYGKLTANPKKTLASIYEFLGQEAFTHNFDNVEQVTWEDDLVHVYKNLHTIRPKVEPQKPDFNEILTKEIVDAYKPVAEFWKTLKQSE